MTKLTACCLLSLLLISYIDCSNTQKDMNSLEELKVESSPVFQHAPLYYYHKFVREHNKVKKNVPLKEHYANERRLRIERDNNLNQIDRLRRQRGFLKRDIEHEGLKLENEEVKEKEALHNVNKIATQRETAVKFEINHDEMWKKYYDKRLKINQGKLVHALPDQVPGLNKLEANDHQRISFYTEAANEQWQLLNNLKARNSSQSTALENSIDRLENQITEVHLKGSEKERHLENGIRKLQEKNQPIIETLKSDVKLDKLRQHTAMREQNAVTKEDAQANKEKAEIAREKKELSKSEKAIGVSQGTRKVLVAEKI